MKNLEGCGIRTRQRFARYVCAGILLVGIIGMLGLFQRGTHISRAYAAASKIGCSGKRCNNTNPYATNCTGQSWDRAWVVKTAPIKMKQGKQVGYVQLWFSATCQTNWARVIAQVPYTEIDAVLRIQGDNNNYITKVTDQAM